MDSVALRRIAQAGKEVDPGWYRVHRRISIHLTRAALAAGITANQASVAMLVLGVAGALLLVPASPVANALGFAVLYLAFLLDKVDGELARLTHTQNARGIFLDRMHHRLVEPGLFLAVAVHEYARSGWVGALVAGFVTMLLANAIDENLHLAPYILVKRMREGDRLPDGIPPPRSPAWTRAAALLRPLKGFRMFIVALPLIALTYLAEGLTGRAVPTVLLVASAFALAIYLAFQCLYYLHEQLDVETQAVARVIRDGMLAGLVLAGLAATAPAHAAGTYHVDGSNPSCSDGGPGSQATPFCTIQAAVNAQNGPGTTIRVWPARYFEEVSVPASGLEGNPFVIEGMGTPGHPVLLDGAVDVSGPAQWSPAANTTWLAASATWSVLQVLADGVRLVPYVGAADSVPEGAFLSVPGTGLYVNLGGADPRKRNMLVSRWTHGVRLDGRSWVTVRGLSIRGYGNRGIFIEAGGNHVIEKNVIERVGRYGINAEGATAVRIADNRVADNGNHGIALTSGTTASTVEGNDCSGNARPETRAANGIYLFDAPGNALRRNRLHHNQDSGIHVQAGSNQTVSVRNISWANGDHGYDHLGASDNVQVNDVAYDNFADGFSVEGSTRNQRMYNCIAARNGRTTGRYQVYVDSSSTEGFASDDNLFWGNVPAGPVKFNKVAYATVAAYSAATGQDTRTDEADPLFYAGDGGDFRLLAGSPAIDAANSAVSGFEALDFEGFGAADDPATANSGLGAIPYADRGAYEFGSPGLVGVPDDPANRTLEGVTPNPFAGEGLLVFATSRPGALVVELLDVRGRKVRELLSEPLAAVGPRSVRLDGRREDGARLEAGVYFYRVRSADGERSGKFVVLH